MTLSLPGLTVAGSHDLESVDGEGTAGTCAVRQVRWARRAFSNGNDTVSLEGATCTRSRAGATV